LSGVVTRLVLLPAVGDGLDPGAPGRNKRLRGYREVP
jgi:hypothetical protein